jgi:hypothetical protein
MQIDLWAIVGALGGYAGALAAIMIFLDQRRATRRGAEMEAQEERWQHVERRINDIVQEAKSNCVALQVQIRGVQEDATREFVRRTEIQGDLDRLERNIAEVRNSVSNGFSTLGSRIDRVLERLSHVS